MLHLKITIDNNSGFCFGVTNAINRAEEILDHGKPLYCIGQIVHNDEEIRRLEQKGMETIDYKRLETLHDQHILFRAHGEPPSTYEMVKRNNNLIIDASCPIIIKLQQRIKKDWETGKKIYIFGKKQHPEIIALKGQTNNEAIIFESFEELKNMWESIPQIISLYSQTTKSPHEFNSIVNFLKQKGIDVSAHDTICRQFCNREPDILKFCRDFKKVIFIAGKNSSNGKELFSICTSVNPQAHFISALEEIKQEWFEPNDSVGICGATSTPKWLMEKAKEYLEKL